MDKLKAFSIHFLISLSVVGVLVFITLWVWYPDFFASANDVWSPLSMVLLVDVGLGPLMTLVLYKKGKPGLKFDLSLVATLQILALSWATWMLYTERPALVAYHDTLMVCLNHEQAQKINKNLSGFVLEHTHVPQALLPEAKTPEEAQARATFMENIPNDAASSLPVHVLISELQPINLQNLPEMLHGEMDLSRVIQNDKYQPVWQDFINKHPDAKQKFAFFILSCSSEEYFAAVDRKTGAIQDIVALPFLNATRKHAKKHIFK